MSKKSGQPCHRLYFRLFWLEDCRQDHRQIAFQNVAGQGQCSRPFVPGAQYIGCPGIARSETSRVGQTENL